ncbi:MAG: 2-polyprenylphenol 6-hydroxylase, partial [Pseudomonadota bacterium]
MFRFVMDFGRLLKAAFVLARHDALVPKEFAHMVPGPLRLIGHLSRIGAKGGNLRPGQRLANALAGEGPAYVKFGQLLATRPDIVGFEMATDLGALQDRMAPFPTAVAKAEIAKALSRPVDDIFTEFS